MKTMRGLSLTVAFITALLTSGCLPGSQLDGSLFTGRAASEIFEQSGGDGAITGYDAYLRSVRPVVEAARCTQCHVVQVPAIGSRDLNTAYELTKQRMNFDSVENSSFLAKALQVDHCAPTCENLGAARWTAALSSWAEAERPKPIVVDTPADTAPPEAPDGSVYQTASVRLAGASNQRLALAIPGTQLTNVFLTFSVEDPVLGDANSMRIIRFKLENQSGRPIYVKGIRLLQGPTATLSLKNLSSGGGVSYADVSKTVASGSNPLLSDSRALLSKAQGTFIAFTFEKLEVGVFTGCKQQTLFNDTVLPVVRAANCIQCHGAGRAESVYWTMDLANPNQLCSDALQRADVENPSLSAVILYPFGMRNGHTRRLNAEQADTVVRWITAE